MIVLDASAVLELLLATDKGRVVAQRIAAPAESLHAPHLVDLEVAQVLRRYAARGQMTDERAAAAVADLHDLDITRYAHDLLLPRIWELRGNVSAYDAAYLALAETLDAPFLTADVALAAVPGARVRVEILH